MTALAAAAKHHEIAVRYAWNARRNPVKRPPILMGTLRIAELERVFRRRFDGRFPQSSDGFEALKVMAEHHVQRNTAEIVQQFVRIRAPWIDEATALRIVREAEQRGSRQTAGHLGWRIKLSPEERRLLRIKTVRAMGQTKESLIEDRRQRDRERKATERRWMGCKTREEYETESNARTKPWEAVGMSRATWYRKGRPMPPAEA